MLRTTIGQLLVNSKLPPEMRDYSRKLDKDGIKKLYRQLAEEHPEKYREISLALNEVAADASYTSGGHSFGIEHLAATRAVQDSRARLTRRVKDILKHPEWTDAQQDEKILDATSTEQQRMEAELYEDAKKGENPLAMQVLSGARGNPTQLKRLLGGDSLYVDHRDRPIPIPVQRSYSEGLSPAEWYAASFGARKGLIDVKFATRDAGYLAKQLGQVAHRLMVVDEDDDRAPDPAHGPRGLPMETDDPDNIGAMLAQDMAGYPRNTVITPKIQQDLENRGFKRILLRSPTVGGPGSGVYARDLGIRERGGLSPNGDMVGYAAAQALSERLTQGGLGSKHSGGVVGGAQSVSGFELINQLAQTPKTFKGGAAHAQLDGRVDAVTANPAGGYTVRVSGKDHTVLPGFELKVQPGAAIEAGDVLSEGIPNPAEIVKHKGIGEGRRYFMQAFYQAYRDSGMPVHRRNVELIARSMIDHVELDEETDDHVPGDIVSYQQIERNWRPRTGAEKLPLDRAVGRYLERPVLHYTIGTPIRKGMLPTLEEFGVKQLEVHAEPPPFQPHMVRAMQNVSHDEDWLTQFIGSGQKSNLLSATHRGQGSSPDSTSFVPALVEGKPFGKTWPQNAFQDQNQSNKSGPQQQPLLRPSAQPR